MYKYLPRAANTSTVFVDCSGIFETCMYQNQWYSKKMLKDVRVPSSNVGNAMVVNEAWQSWLRKPNEMLKDVPVPSSNVGDTLVMNKTCHSWLRKPNRINEHIYLGSQI